MTLPTRPLILLTNDDGVQSPGLRAAAAALWSLGDLLIAAPQHQQSSTGRSYPPDNKGCIRPTRLLVDGGSVEAFGVEGSPAQTVLHALLELAPRQPDLAVVGINYGENLGSSITSSGTVGAALEAAVAGIPAVAVSLETAPRFHYSHSLEIDFVTAAEVTRFFAHRLLASDVRLPFDADLLKIDVPQDATLDTPWRVTRVSRHEYFEAIAPQRHCLEGTGPLHYRPRSDWPDLEPDSDIYAVIYDRVISVAPVSLDLSSRVDRLALEQLLRDSH